MKKKRKEVDHSGSSFNSFLDQEGIREDVEMVAVKRVLAQRRSRGSRKHRPAVKVAAE